jgi:hypothetical protein
MMDELTCYVFPDWDPRIRPAEATRDWMAASPHGFATRCLPLNVANAHGWELLSYCGFSASWNGGQRKEDVRINLDPGPVVGRPVSLFGVGTLTFHIAGLFRTPPGWNLWVGGSPNRFKDAIQPLTGIVETDWSVYSFTMNWKFTRRNHTVRFERDEPIAFVFPVPRAGATSMRPVVRDIAENPDLREQYLAWTQDREEFRQRMKGPDAPPNMADRWQKRYMRGADMRDQRPVADHVSKLRLPPFEKA